MNDNIIAVTGGVDCHQRTHRAVALDQTGRMLGDAEFPATARGYRELLAWLQQFGTITAIGVESTGAYGAALTRCLRAAGMAVVEVNQPHPHTRSRRGKTDAVDAEAAARKVLAGEATVIPKDTTGAVEAIRQLQVARHGAVKARSAALCQLGELITTAPANVRETLTCSRKTLEGQASLCARFRPDTARLDDPVQAAKFALRGVAQRIAGLRREVAAYDKQLDTLVAAVAPRTLALPGVGTHHTAQLLVTAGQNIDRFHGDAAFAHLCGADPIPASSGKAIRHRLNPGGDRAANRTLHLIAVVRLRYCERTRAYAERRRAEGKTNKEILRCLKRYIARQTYRTLLDDLGAQPT
jgi:transposase